MRVVRDSSWRDVDDETVLAGSPLRLFRVTPGGRAVLERAIDGDLEEPTVVQSRFLDRFIDAGAVHPLPTATGIALADVTVVMPVRGTWPSAPLGCRVIIVDDASEPPLARPADSHAESTRVELIRLDSNVGPGAARMVGLEQVESPFVAFLDADVDLPEKWLDGLLAHFADERVVAVAPRVASRAGHSALETYEATHSPLDLGDEPALVAPGSRISYVPSAVLVARTDAVRSCGGFDPMLRFGEDVDLVWRLVEAGGQVRYEPRVVAVHRPRATWSAWFRQRVGYGSSAAPLASRHGEAVAPVRCSGWSLVVWMLALTGRRWAVAGAIALAASTGLLLQRRLPRLPEREAWRLVGRGHLLAGMQLARATRRVWWPIAVCAAIIGGRRVRTVMALLVLAPSLDDARTSRRGAPADTARAAAIGLADDAAYGYGVWKGVVAQRSLRAVWPAVSAWPPRDAD